MDGISAFLAGLALIAGASRIPPTWARAGLGALVLLTLALTALQALQL